MWCKIQHWDTGTVNLQLWCSAAAMLAHCGCNSGRVQLKLWCNSGAWKLQLWCIAAATLVQWKLSGCAGQVLSCISGKPHELNHYWSHPRQRSQYFTINWWGQAPRQNTSSRGQISKNENSNPKLRQKLRSRSFWSIALHCRGQLMPRCCNWHVRGICGVLGVCGIFGAIGNWQLVRVVQLQAKTAHSNQHTCATRQPSKNLQ